MFSTAGGEAFYLYGFNLGPTSPASTVQVRAWYGHDADSYQYYEASNCSLVVSQDSMYKNTIRCFSVPGVGFDLSFTVAVGAHLNNGNGSNSGHTRIFRNPLWLGFNIDSEKDGAPSANALGDGDDEDRQGSQDHAALERSRPAVRPP